MVLLPEEDLKIGWQQAGGGYLIFFFFFLKEDLMSTSLPVTELHFLGPCDMLI